MGGILASEHEGQNMEHEQYYPVLVFMPGSKSAHLRILLMKEDLFKLGMLPGVDDEVRVDQAGVKVVNPDSPEMERLQAVQKTKTANDNRNEMMNRLAVTVHRLVDESPSL